MKNLVLWLPRVCGIAVGLFIAVFALDAFSATNGWVASLGDFAIHLIPALLIGATVAAAWRREAFGAAVFLVLALLYAGSAIRHPAWVLLISGPLFVESILYLIAWRHRGARPA